MADFFRKLLKKLPALSNGRRQPGVCVGAFGKHPAWNDHIDPDISLEGNLPAIKQSLYLDGIRDRAIARWRGAAPDQLIPFGHVVLWRLPGEELAAARLWHSRDGRGRDDFPLVACAQCTGLPLAWVLSTVLPLLEELERDLSAADTRDAVIARVHGARDGLRAAAQSAPRPEARRQAPQDALLRISEAAEMGPEGLARVLHLLREIAAEKPDAPRFEHVRVPWCAASIADAVLTWTAALDSVLGADRPLLCMVPAAQKWIDITVGAWDASSFLNLRSSLKLAPLTTDIAYNLQPPFVAHVNDLLRQARAGRAMALA